MEQHVSVQIILFEIFVNCKFINSLELLFHSTTLRLAAEVLPRIAEISFMVSTELAKLV